MTHEQADSNTMPEQMMDWLGVGGSSSLPHLPSIFDDPYQSDGFTSDSWWAPNQTSDQEHINNSFTTTTITIIPPLIKTEEEATDVVVVPHTLLPVHVQSQPSDSSIKRKAYAYDDVVITPKKSLHKSKKNLIKKSGDDDEVALSTRPKKLTGNRKPVSKTAVSNTSYNKNSNNKDGRWAEQLLNPCAAAINASNQTRVQHLLCVINELSSLTGDANHRLAAHGLHALTQTQRVSPTTATVVADNYATTNPKFFTVSLINFNDVNPWFRIPNSIANSSILQILMEHDQVKVLHILDIGVSHGIQWPTLLEELSRRSGGPPPRVRITLLEEEGSIKAPFLVSPQGYNCSSQLLSFAKAININLEINRLNDFPLLNLDSRVIKSTPDETLIICAQFRIHNLNHNNPDDRTRFLKVLKNMNPSGVVLSENNVECSCNNCVDFATGFSRRVDCLWRFLDSTSVAYKGRESNERQMMEGEAAKALTNADEMNEKKEQWFERMRSVGFGNAVFGDDAIDGARALLRKYDSNWEIRMEDKEGCLCLWWKGQPVSFCSLWKVDP